MGREFAGTSPEDVSLIIRDDDGDVVTEIPVLDVEFSLNGEGDN